MLDSQGYVKLVDFGLAKDVTRAAMGQETPKSINSAVYLKILLHSLIKGY